MIFERSVYYRDHTSPYDLVFGHINICWSQFVLLVQHNDISGQAVQFEVSPILRTMNGRHCVVCWAIVKNIVRDCENKGSVSEVCKLFGLNAAQTDNC